MCEYCAASKTVAYIDGMKACMDCVREHNEALGLSIETIVYLGKVKENNS